MTSSNKHLQDKFQQNKRVYSEEGTWENCVEKACISTRDTTKFCVYLSKNLFLKFQQQAQQFFFVMQSKKNDLSDLIQVFHKMKTRFAQWKKCLE